MTDRELKKEHILACLSPSPSNAKIIRTAAQMARAFGGNFTALYVKTPQGDGLSRENRERLQKNIRLAEDLGAVISTVYSDDVPRGILEFARLSRVTKIVLGRSRPSGRSLVRRPSLTDRLIKAAPSIDIHVIPDADAAGKLPWPEPFSGLKRPSLRHLLLTLLTLTLSTAVGYLFYRLEFTEANIITVYILGALLTALFTKNYICSTVASLFSVILFNFFFTEPRLTLLAYESGYPVTFAIMLLSSLIIGTLANRLATNASQSAQAAYRTEVLLQNNQLLQKAEQEQEVLRITSEQLTKLLSRDLVIHKSEDCAPETALYFPTAASDDRRTMLTPQECAVAREVFRSRKRAGAGTDRMRDALGLYLAIRTEEEVFCVVGIRVGSKPIEPFENSLLLSILGDAALAMLSIRSRKEKEEIALLAKNEQLRADLLRAISHDLRTPLTSISGNAETLLCDDGSLDKETRLRILQDMQADSSWLIGLVENLLSITRISEGRMQLKLSAYPMEDILQEASRHLSRRAGSHKLSFIPCDTMLLADMDARLVIQVIINLVDNALKYTPPESKITVSARKDGGNVVLTVADNGPGISNTEKAQVFEMFYTGEHSVADRRRSLGLGLALCHSIVTAHGGRITVTDNQPHGAVFSFTLPASEVNLNE